MLFLVCRDLYSRATYGPKNTVCYLEEMMEPEVFGDD